MSLLMVAAATTQFTLYPAFVDPYATIETQTDKGLIVEMIVNCPDGAGILTFDKVEKVYCGPDHTCHSAIEPAVDRLCR